MRLIEVPVGVGPMKPQLLSLPRAGRLRIPLTLKTTMQTAYGARSYMRTAQIARKGSLTAQETRFFCQFIDTIVGEGVKKVDHPETYTKGESWRGAVGSVRCGD